MAQRFRDLTSCFFLLCLATLAWGQDGANAEEKLLKCDFKVFSLNRQPIEDLYYELSGEDVLLEFKKKRRSDAYHYEGPQDIQFFTLQLDEAGNKIRMPAGSVMVDLSNVEPLLFFLPVQKSGSEQPKYAITTIEDSERAFPYGSLIIFNASGVTLSGKAGDQEMHLSYGPTAPMQMHKFRDNADDSWIKVFFAAEVAENEYELVYRNNILFRSERRVVMVLRPPRRPRSIKIETYLIEQFAPEDSLAPDEFHADQDAG